MLDLLHDLKRGRTWRDVAEIIARCSGVKKSDVWYLRLMRGDKQPLREDINAVAACYPGQPILPPTATELVDTYEVKRTIIASADPDAVLFFEAGEIPIRRVVLEEGDADGEIVTSRLATKGSRVYVQRKRQQESVLSYMSDLASMPSNSFATQKGKTGNLERISRAAADALRAYDSAN